MFRPFFLLILIVFAGACNNAETKSNDTTVDPVPSAAATPPASNTFTYQTFPAIDSLGVSHGYGYDIYQDGKLLIHQLTIPGEPGTDGFVSAQEAEMVAILVVEKMKAGGGFPTVSHIELLDLGITLKTQ